MRRPVGVVVACIILGFGALILLMMSVAFLFLSTMMGHIPIPTPPGQPTLDAGVMSGVMIGIGLVCLIPTAWAAITVIGLARMKNWARYSIIIIGVGLVLFSILGLFGAILSQTLLATTQQTTGQDPAMLRFGMIINGVTFFAMMGIGIWWIVYFALRTTREAFTMAVGLHPIAIPGYIPPPSPYAASSYEVASYIPAPDPNAPPVASPVLMLDEAGVVANTPPRRPLAITIIGWLLIVGAAVTLPFSFLPFPTFILGVAISGWPAHLTMLSFAVIGLLTGIGLLRLEKIALYTAYAFCMLGIVNSSLFLLPSVRDRMFAYQMDMIRKFSMGVPQPFPFDNHMMALMMVPGVVFTVAYCLTLIILLFINRAAFDRPAQAAAA